MTTFTNLLKIAMSSMAVFITSFSYGLTYTSLTDGNWNNNINVWSTDGITPCGCSPGYNINNKGIIINHNIITTGNLNFTNGTIVTVNSIGSLGTGHSVEVQSATFNILGVSTFSSIVQKINSEINIIGTTVTLNNKYDVQAGLLNVNNSYLLITSGNLDIALGATVNVINKSKVDIDDGNIQNYGSIHIDIESCASASGAWRNYITGIVSGTGSAISTGGNMSNNNIWDLLITWCSTGADSGMPSPENCTIATNICNGMVLPVDLIALEATVSHNHTAKITWATASEKNLAYFKVMKLVAGQEWEEIDHITATENSTVLHDYYSMDLDYNVGDVYYRLIQVDLDGNEFYSDVVSISFEGNISSAFLYPNPINTSEELTISNLSDESSVITVISVASNLVMAKVNVQANKTVSLSMEKLKSGLYFVKVEQQYATKTIKLVVTE